MAALASLTARKRPALLPSLVAGCLIFVAVVTAATFGQVSSTIPLCNLAAIGIAYLAVSFLVFAPGLGGTGKRYLTSPIQIIAGLVVLVGYLLATFGAFLLVIVLSRAQGPAVETHRLTDGLICRVRILPGIPDEDAILVEIFRSLEPIPIQRRVAHVVKGEDYPPKPTCTDALREMG